MNPSTLLAALLTGSGLGWMAVLHCYAMCGPLHMTLCALSPRRPLWTLTCYNLGRIFGYTLAGALFGAFGAFIQLAPACCHAGPTLRSLSLSRLLPGLFMLVIAWAAFRKKGASAQTAGLLARLFKPSAGRLGILGLGVLTAMIPCGVLYMAYAAAVGTAHTLAGALLLLAFAVTQTFFMQLGISVGRSFSVAWGKRFERAFPWIALAAAGVYLGLFLRDLPALG